MEYSTAKRAIIICNNLNKSQKHNVYGYIYFKKQAIDYTF